MCSTLLQSNVDIYLPCCSFHGDGYFFVIHRAAQCLAHHRLRALQAHVNTRCVFGSYGARLETREKGMCHGNKVEYKADYYRVTVVWFGLFELED